MVLDRRASVNRAAANTLLSPNEQISAKMNINVSLAAADSAAVLGIGYPMGFNSTTGKHAPWMAPDPTVVVITLTGATGGTFGMTINDLASEPTAFDFDISAAELQARLLAFGFDTTVVLGTLIYTITFDGAAQLAVLPTVTADLSLITGDLGEGVTVSDGTAQDESSTIMNVAFNSRTGGSWTVTYDGNESAGIAFAASALDIENAILAIGTHAPDSVFVSRAIGVKEVFIAFNDIADLLSLPSVSGNVSTLTGGSDDGVAAVTVGDVLSLASASEVEVDVGTATGGTFTVTANGSTTAAIPFDASAGDVDTALANIGFTVVTDLTSEVYTIVFSGKAEVITLPTLSGDIALLTGAGLSLVSTAGEATNGTHVIVGFINPNQTQIGTKSGTAALVVLADDALDEICTATTTNPHNLVTGMSITVTGASDAKLNITATITVLTPTTFTYPVAEVDLGVSTSGAYTTTNVTMVMMMSEGTITASLPESLVASSDVTALRTALKDNLVTRNIYVQGLAGVN